MTKEEKIKEAWDSLPEKVFKKVIINDGWLYYGYACNGWDDVEEYLESFNCDVNRDNYEMRYDQCDNGDLINVHVRPKSLQGIENNKGWIKIESESDLPKLEKLGDEILCFIKCNEYNEIGVGKFSFGTFKTLYGNHYNNITHYKQINKPEPPLY